MGNICDQVTCVANAEGACVHYMEPVWEGFGTPECRESRMANRCEQLWCSGNVNSLCIYYKEPIWQGFGTPECEAQARQMQGTSSEGDENTSAWELDIGVIGDVG